MKYIPIIAFLILSMSSSCVPKKEINDTKLISVSILPQKYFVEQIKIQLDSWREKLEGFKAENKKVVIWGGGSKCHRRWCIDKACRSNRSEDIHRPLRRERGVGQLERPGGYHP